MAKKKFAIDFDGFLELAEQIDNMGEGYLKQATENALTKSKEYVNNAIIEAMDQSPYQFTQNRQSNKGVGGIAVGEGRNRRATGKAKKSVQKIAQEPVTWEGNTAVALVGADLEEAPELLILALGTPHIKGDRNLNNAIKVKGKYRKQMSKIQQEEFMKVLQEAQDD